jgi:hypothetical protein
MVDKKFRRNISLFRFSLEDGDNVLLRNVYIYLQEHTALRTQKTNIVSVSRQVYPASLIDTSVSYCQKALVGESGMTRTNVGKHNKRSVVVAMYGTTCVISPRKM